MPARGYDAVQKGLHWLIAALVVAQFTTKLVSPATFQGVTEDGLNAAHLAIGPTILLLTLVRLGWRLARGAPPPPDDLAPALRWVSQATHAAFYALLIVVPVLGWISASEFGARANLLGLVGLPMLAGPNERGAEWWGAIHGTLAWALLALAVLHVAAASWHGLARDDGVFARMLPGK